MFSRYCGLCLILTVVLSPCYGDTNIITNGDFENGTDGWMNRGCSINAVDSPVHSGSGSAKVLDRTDGWQGIKQSVMGKMQDGETYEISGWVRIENGSDTVIVSVEQTDDSGTQYINLGKAEATDSNWVEVSGEFTLDVDGVLTTLDVYFEGPQPEVNFFVDDVTVYGPGPSEPSDANEPEDTTEGISATKE